MHFCLFHPTSPTCLHLLPSSAALKVVPHPAPSQAFFPLRFWGDFPLPFRVRGGLIQSGPVKAH